MKTLPARMLLALGLGLLILTARAGAQDVQGWSDIYYDPPTDTVYADAYTHLDSSLDPYDTIYEALVTLEVVAPNGSYYVEGESYGYDAQASIMLSPSESGYGDYSETATHGVYIDGRDWYSLSSVEYQEGYGFIGFTPFRCPDDAEPLPPSGTGTRTLGRHTRRPQLGGSTFLVRAATQARFLAILGIGEILTILRNVDLLMQYRFRTVVLVSQAAQPKKVHPRRVIRLSITVVLPRGARSTRESSMRTVRGFWT